MKITELFTSNKQWQWTFQDENQAIATFEIGGVPYKFFAAQDSDEAPGDWEIEFTAKVASTGNEIPLSGQNRFCIAASKRNPTKPGR